MLSHPNVTISYYFSIHPARSAKNLSRYECLAMQVATDFFLKKNIFLYTENKTRIYRTKIQMDCLSRIKQKYTQEERLLRVSTAQRLKTATGYPQLKVARPRYTSGQKTTNARHIIL